jgi:hypothetical protein
MSDSKTPRQEEYGYGDGPNKKSKTGKPNLHQAREILLHHFSFI